MEKIILITGSSRGIGAATAIRAAKEGYKVCINYRDNKAAAMQVAEQVRASGAACLTIQADVSKENEVLSLFEKIDKETGTLTALVNNAGILEQQTGILGLDSSRLQRIWAANIDSVILCSREAVKRMSTERGGHGGAIVNVSSVAARLGAPGEYVDYAASKGAVDSITLGLAKELAPWGIRVNAVRPGFIYSDIHASGGEPGRVDRLAASLPMKRGGYPDEVAAAILWLLSANASYTTGSFLEVAGGR